MPERFLRPARAALKPCLAAVATATDPTAAWQELADQGHIPNRWREDPQRCFPWFHGLAPSERERGLRHAPHVPWSTVPDDVTACALLAADVAGVERAEAAGRSFVSAMGAWGVVTCADRVMWVPTSIEGHRYQLTDTKPDVWEPEAHALRAIGADWGEVERVMDRLRGEASAMPPRRRAIAAATLGVWIYAAERWADTVAANGGRADPFTHALDVYDAGYALMPSGDGVLMLGYPTGPLDSW